MNYSEIIQFIANSILIRFDTIYHSAEIITIKDDKFPAVTVGDEWINLSPSDQQETIYIRRNGDDEALEELKIGSCVKSYKMRSSLRIVFFKDHAKNHNEILSKLMQSVLIGRTKLNKIIKDKWKLQKDESSGNYNFGPSTAYFAIDIYALWNLTPNTCDEDYCLEIQNPLRCPVVALEF